MAAYNNTRGGTTTTALGSALRASPEPMDPERHGYAAAAAGTETMQGHGRGGGPVSPSAIRRASAPIHHHIAPALGAPFMKAEGLVHRGLLT